MEGKFFLSSTYTLQNFAPLGAIALPKALTLARGLREAMHPARQQRQHLHRDRQPEEHPAAARPCRASPARGRGRCPRGSCRAALRAPARPRALSSGAVLNRTAEPTAALGRSSPRPQKWSIPSPPPVPGRGEETGEGRGRRSMRAPLRGPASRSPCPPAPGGAEPRGLRASRRGHGWRGAASPPRTGLSTAADLPGAAGKPDLLGHP